MGADIVGPFTFSAHDSDIATLSIVGNALHVTGHKRGSFDVKIIDANGVESNSAKVEVLDVVLHALFDNQISNIVTLHDGDDIYIYHLCKHEKRL